MVWNYIKCQLDYLIVAYIFLNNSIMPIWIWKPEWSLPIFIDNFIIYDLILLNDGIDFSNIHFMGSVVIIFQILILYLPLIHLYFLWSVWTSWQSCRYHSDSSILVPPSKYLSHSNFNIHHSWILSLSNLINVPT